MQEPSLHDYDSRTLEAVILVKAAPQSGGVQGVSVFSAALDLYRNWLRLSPVSFRVPEEEQRFGRWDRIRFRGWKPSPAQDARPEARQVGQKTIEILGQLPRPEQAAFLSRVVVHGLRAEAEAGRSLALLKAEVLGFACEKLGPAEFVERCATFRQLREQLDLFGQSHLMPAEPIPYAFCYRLRDADGERVHTCEDWEMDAAFLVARKRHGEKKALEDLTRLYGEGLPRQGIAFIMGTSAASATSTTDPRGWVVHGLVPFEDQPQATLF
ncbi:MAG TPA: hypothetical protein VIG90_01945 [Pedomonas sp.]|uniref:hypothetical protein n=1 Tax=Pedomonas sp. TaxID=2976421 RepID=UPI002F429181